MPLKTLFKILIPIVMAGMLFVVFTRSQPLPVDHTSQPTTFQPEAQMMTQSMAVGGQEGKDAAALESDPHDTQARPVTHDATGPYKYDPGVCRTTTTTPYLCLAAYYRRTVRAYSIDTAIADIKRRFEDNANVKALCHPFMHVIGQEASHHYATVSEAYLHGDNFCWSGYYHGIMEGVIADIGEKNLPAKMDTICADIPGKASYNFDYYNCVHGLGHGVMELNGDEVFASLKLCDNLTGWWEQQSCYSGVFMENIIASNNYGKPISDWKYLNPKKPLYPCDVVEDRYKEQCYLGQTSYALEVLNYDFSKVVPLCVAVEGTYRDICFQSVGRDAANQAMHNAERTQATCGLATKNDFSNCVIGAVKEFVSYYHDLTEAQQFCAILAEPDRSLCQTTATTYFKVF